MGITTEKQKSEEYVVEVENITKKFRIFSDKPMTLKERLVKQKKASYRDFYALKNVSFSVKKGSSVALVGKNGCGKSTMLKIINRTMYPNEGKVKVNGKVSSLIELGAGFHPELSGRENIYTNATIFGFTKKEIEKRIPEIIAFSELGEFIDNPVRTYSSGMYARLAFSVAIQVDADILLVDEILGVGDAKFQEKCADKMDELRESGLTIIMVTHDSDSVIRLCDQVIWMSDGVVMEKGDPREMIHKYNLFLNGEPYENIEVPPKVEEETSAVVIANAETNEEVEVEEQEELGDPLSTGLIEEVLEREQEPKRWGSGEVQIHTAYFCDETGEITSVLETGKPASIIIEYESAMNIENPIIGIGVYRSDGLLCYGTNTKIDKRSLNFKEGLGKITFQIDKNSLMPGEYFLDVAIEKKTGDAYDYYKEVTTVYINSLIDDIGVVRLGHQWVV